MSIVYLVSTFVFTILLYIEDSYSREKFSVGLWIPFIWLLRASSRSITYWLNPNFLYTKKVDLSSGNSFERNFLTILMVLSVIILLSRKYNWRTYIKQYNAQIMLFLLMLLSIIWSEYPGLSFRRYFRAIGDLLMVLVVITERDPLSAFVAILRRCAYLLIPLSIVFIRYYRNIGIMYSYDGALQLWIGVAEGKNGLGQLACISSIVFIDEIFQNRNKIGRLFVSSCYLLMCFYLLNGSPTARSSTSLGAFLFGLFIYIVIGFKSIKKNRNVFLLFIILILTFSLFFLLIGNSIIGFLAGLFNRDATLTGRIPLWNALLSMGRETILLGKGYGSFWTNYLIEELWSMFIWRPNSGHNGFVDIFLELGIFGIFVFGRFLIEGLKNVNRINISFESLKYQRLRFSLFFTILLYNFTESSFLRSTSYLWFIFLLCITVSSPEKKINNYEIVDVKNV